MPVQYIFSVSLILLNLDDIVEILPDLHATVCFYQHCTGHNVDHPSLVVFLSGASVKCLVQIIGDLDSVANAEGFC